MLADISIHQNTEYEEVKSFVDKKSEKTGKNYKRHNFSFKDQIYSNILAVNCN